jgi:negative regulator of flagellin synthesis FlgM
MRVNQGSSQSQNSEVSGPKKGSKAQEAKESKRTDKGAPTGKASNSDTNTEISGKGKEFALAKAAATGTSDVREDRVADLKRRIADGSYKVNSEAVADRMVDEHLKSGIG